MNASIPYRRGCAWSAWRDVRDQVGAHEGQCEASGGSSGPGSCLRCCVPALLHQCVCGPPPPHPPAWRGCMQGSGGGSDPGPRRRP